MFAPLLYVLALLWTLAPQKPPDKPTIAISIATLDRSQGTAVLDQPGASFYVVFENRSLQAQNLLHETCSWGYEMLELEAVDAQGHTYTITRVPRGWYRNVPDPMPLAPGETVLRGIELGSGSWQGLPAVAAGQAITVKLRAILHLQSGRPLSDSKIWFGTVKSNWATITLKRL